MTDYDDKDVKLESIHYPHLIVYKVVGDETNLSDFVKNRYPKIFSDWSGIYFQLSKSHALRTIFNRLDQGYQSMNLIEITMKNVYVNKFFGEIFSDSSVSGSKKAVVVKELLSIDRNDILVQSVKCPLMIEEFKGEFEIIVPIDFILEGKIKYSEIILSEYKVDSKFNVHEKNINNPLQFWKKIRID